MNSFVLLLGLLFGAPKQAKKLRSPGLKVERLEERDTPSTTYTITPNPATVDEGAGTLSLTVTRSGGLPGETIFATTLQDQGYTNSGDYTGFINQNLTFALNQTQATVNVAITNDTVVESNESFSLIVQRNAS